MAHLFTKEKTSVVKHIKNIYKSKELYEEATYAKIAQVQLEGWRLTKRQIDDFSLGVIIAVGYDFNSLQ